MKPINSPTFALKSTRVVIGGTIIPAQIVITNEKIIEIAEFEAELDITAEDLSLIHI